ncbi:MAG: EamA family transporter, partial [Limnohabitans sp.]
MNYVVAKTAPSIISPHVLALGRWFLAGLILAFIARSELWQERQSTLNAWKQYVVLGTLGMLICGAWVYWAAETTTAINIALI